MLVSREQANNYINLFEKIQNELTEQVDFKARDSRLKSYYGTNLQSFVFSRKDIEELWKGSQSNGLRIYFGAQNTGTPTIVLVPCTLSSEKTVTNVVSNDQKAALETPVTPHPPIPKMDGDTDIGNDNFQYT